MNANRSRNRNPFEKILKKKPESIALNEVVTKLDTGDLVYEFLDSDSDDNRIDQENKETEDKAPNTITIKEKPIEVKVLNGKNELRTTEKPLSKPKKFKLVDPEIPSSRKELPKPILPKYQRVYGSDGDYLEKKHAIKEK